MREKKCEILEKLSKNCCKNKLIVEIPIRILNDAFMHLPVNRIQFYTPGLRTFHIMIPMGHLYYVGMYDVHLRKGK